MFPTDDKIKRLKTLSKAEMRLAFYLCQGITADDKLDILLENTEKTRGTQKSEIYRKLGLDKLPDSEKFKVLVHEYKEPLIVVVPNEEALKTYVPAPSKAPKIDDTSPNKPVNPPPPIVTKRSIRPSWVAPLFIGGCLSGIVFLVFLVLLIQSGILNFKNPLAILPTDTGVSATEALLPSPNSTQLPPTLRPTSTPSSPVVASTVTSNPSPTDEPTNTPTATREYYNQGEWVSLGGDTYISLRNTFGRSGENCGAPSGGFSVILNLKNTANQQFLLRFEPSAFNATDDTGNEYQLAWTKYKGDPLIGIQNLQIYFADICLGFTGSFPLESKYLIITSDSINGVKLVFRKDL